MNNVRQCLVAGFFWAVAVSVASAEMFLPQHEITFSGQVVAPSCQARLDTNKLVFSFEKEETRRQRVSLSVSGCDVSGLGVRFGATALTQYPERGILKDADNQPVTGAWFTIGPVIPSEDDTRFVLTADSTDLVKGEGDTRYFLLGRQIYWYDIKDEISDDQALSFPFDVVVHRGKNTQPQGQSEYSASFALQLSYR